MRADFYLAQIAQINADDIILQFFLRDQRENFFSH